MGKAAPSKDTDFIRQFGNYSPKLKITLDLISRDPSKYLRSIWFLPLPSA